MLSTGCCRMWQIERPRRPRFRGWICNDSGDVGEVVRVITKAACQDGCLTNDLPKLTGWYDAHGKLGIPCEVEVLRMDDLIAIGVPPIPFYSSSRIHDYLQRAYMLTVSYPAASRLDPS
ncbi:hypothetical protein BC628DRAFT_1418994 [Trametes gibbosa]|nr:hypothetical protein BC628DRAFT_1418994 [Trametes gibbosa]